MPERHVVDRYLAAAAFLGVRNDGKGLDYFVGAGEGVERADDLPFVAFVIGAAHATKRLEEGQIIRICATLPHPVVLLGGPAEAALGDRIAATGTHIENACGKYPLNGSADLVRQAAVVITHDTGLMHVAAAYRKAIVSVWGNTVPALGMYSYLPDAEAQVVAEVKGLDCRPCSKIGYASCPQGHFRCMREQDLEQITKAALLAVET